MAAGGATARVAAADAAQVDGRLRAGLGGGAQELPGARLASSGLPVARWNVADVDDPARADPDAIRAWFARAGGGVPWRARVPAGARWPDGRHVLTARCLATGAATFRAQPAPPDARVRDARRGDAEAAAAVLGAQLGVDAALCRRWLEPQLGSARHRVVLLEVDAAVVAVGVGLRAFDRAGPCVTLIATALAEEARDARLGAALVSDLVARGLAGGARIAVRVTEDPDEDVAPLLALGFADAERVHVYENA